MKRLVENMGFENLTSPVFSRINLLFYLFFFSSFGQFRSLNFFFSRPWFQQKADV